MQSDPMNPQLELVNQFIEFTGSNIFLTGRAGTGKTTFLQYIKQKSPKRMVITAPTGVAAINAGGITLHSFLQIPFGPYIPTFQRKSQDEKNKSVHRFRADKIRLIRSIDLLVIDEISMVRADLLDAVNDTLQRYRRNSLPFGGVQVLMIGDLQQLAPVAKSEEWELLKEHYQTPYFFSSKVLQSSSYVSIELEKIYRQVDNDFILLLNKVRDNCLGVEDIEMINSRYIPDYDPEAGCVILTTHNHQAKTINEKKLDELQEKEYRFQADVRGKFPENAYPNEEDLVLKVGAQVMFVKNDASSAKEYYNGKIGTVVDIKKDSVCVKSKDSEEEIWVGQAEWTNATYSVDAETKEITEEIEGTFSQLPLKPAWAITIHKSQGLTFDKAVIEVNEAFAHGQVYVALSRCRSFEGVILRQQLNPYAVITDGKVVSFSDQIQKDKPTADTLEEYKRHYYLELLLEQFDFESYYKKVKHLQHVMEQNTAHLYPELFRQLAEHADFTLANFFEVGKKFGKQLAGMISQNHHFQQDEKIKERIRKGAAYFIEHLEKAASVFSGKLEVDIDNKEIRKIYTNAVSAFEEEFRIKFQTLRETVNDFSVSGYLKTRAMATIEPVKVKAGKGTATRKAEKEATDHTADDIAYPALYETLRLWRRSKVEESGLPAYTIMHQKTMLAIVRQLPNTERQLLAIRGIGKKVMEKYGNELLDIVNDFCFDQHIKFRQDD